MKIGLIDVDGHNYPNLPLMKLSAYHKKQGHNVKWYETWDGQTTTKRITIEWLEWKENKE